jgi:predicted permease
VNEQGRSSGTEGIRQDVRLVIRQLLRSPGFTLLATLTLALGIGATTVIFSLVHAILLKPLPFPHPEELQAIQTLQFPHGKKDLPVSAGNWVTTTYGDFFDWRDQNQSYQGLASYNAIVRLFDSESSGSARVLDASEASAGLFETLGVQPVLGRTFTRNDEQPGNRSVILSHDLWVSDFGSATDVIGRKVKVSDRVSTVIGVLPAAFRFPIDHPAEFWISSAWSVADARGNPEVVRTSEVQEVVGRLKPGVTPAQANADLNTIQRNIARHYQQRSDEYAVDTAPEIEAFVYDLEKPLKLLMAAVSALLLIACCNVAGLLLARATGRSGEMAVRAALGASRWRVMRPLLIEALLLGVTGCLLGIGLAWSLLHIALRFVPQNIPRLDQVSLDWQVLAFAVGISLACSLGAGLLPAWRMRKVAPSLAMRENSGNATAGRGQHRLHSLLVIGETALGLILLVCSGLLMRSFQAAIHVDPGFNPNGLLTAGIALTDSRYTQAQMDNYFKQLMPKLHALPGVENVSAGLPLPLQGNERDAEFQIVGRPASADHLPDEFMSIVEPNYFETLADPLLRGRLFTDFDHETESHKVAIVNQAFAKKYFPGRDPIGQHIILYINDSPYAEREIIGVVGDMKRVELRSDDTPEFFLPYAQALVHRPTLVMRVAGDPSAYVHLLETTALSIDPEALVFQVRTMVESEMSSLDQQRFEAMLLSGFATFSLVLTAVGLYGMLAYMVAQRAREMGLRMALGAGRGNIIQLVLSRGLALATCGLAVGLVASFFASRLLTDLLFSIKPMDIPTYLGVTALLLAVAVCASLAPAFRAAQIDPIKTLRDS